MRYVIALVVLFTFSCKSQKPNKETDEKLTLLVQDGYFPVENPETQIIKDAKSLRAFFSKVNQTRKPGLPVPEIDFTTHSVLVACLGARNTKDFPIMRIKDQTLNQVNISVRLPDKKQDFFPESFPFCVYSIPNEGKKITIEIE